MPASSALFDNNLGAMKDRPMGHFFQVGRKDLPRTRLARDLPTGVKGWNFIQAGGSAWRLARSIAERGCRLLYQLLVRFGALHDRQQLAHRIDRRCLSQSVADRPRDSQRLRREE